jgi:diacylglycerol kinase family enzyme
VRGLLVVNPKATTTTLRGRDVLVSALGDTLKLDCAETTHRDHAIELGRQAKAAGYDTVLVLGGDGTVNEVVNGLLAAGPASDAPALAIVPGRSTNVFARSLGLPASPMEATGQLLEALRAGRSTRVGLGQADDRWFTFCAGLGLVAAAVARVEDRRAKGKRSTPGLYVRSTVNRYFFGTNRRNAPLQLSVPSAPGSEAAGEGPATAPEPIFVGLVCNTSPWTYLGERRIEPCPEASFETGLDLMALRRLGLFTTLRAARRLLVGAAPRGRAVALLHDLHEFTISATEGTQPFQVDGDALGERESVTFRSVPGALRVIV